MLLWVTFYLRDVGFDLVDAFAFSPRGGENIGDEFVDMSGFADSIFNDVAILSEVVELCSAREIASAILAPGSFAIVAER